MFLFDFNIVKYIYRQLFNLLKKIPELIYLEMIDSMIVYNILFNQF